VINSWIKRFIKTLKLIFLERFADGGNNTPNRMFRSLIVLEMSMYKEVFDIYKLIALQIHVQLLSSTWECLLLALLEIQNFLLTSYPSNKTTIVSNIPAAEDCADMVLETLLYSWLRAPAVSDTMWLILRRQLKKSTGWNQTIWQWSVY
jgi:hypothetical protein